MKDRDHDQNKTFALQMQNKHACFTYRLETNLSFIVSNKSLFPSHLREESSNSNNNNKYMLYKTVYV